MYLSIFENLALGSQHLALNSQYLIVNTVATDWLTGIERRRQVVRCRCNSGG